MKIVTRSSIAGADWKAYVLAQTYDALARLAPQFPPGDPLVVSAYAAWERGDAHQASRLAHQLKVLAGEAKE